MIRKIMLTIATALPLFMATLTFTPAYAFNVIDDSVCNGRGAQSTVCKDSRRSNENQITGSNGVILRVVNLLAIITGAAAIIIIIISGLRMVTGGGNKDDVAGARKAVIYAAVGLVIIALSRTIVAFVLEKI